MSVVVFIDGNNIFHSAKTVGVDIDYQKLLRLVAGSREVLRAIFYTHVDETERQRGFLLWMSRNGFRVVQKVSKEGKRADITAEMVTDMCMLSRHVQTVILVSGDEDFAYPLDLISREGVRVEVASFRSATASKLADVADRILDLELPENLELIKKTTA
jgi:uncharacterized LabA/DUF88 family protein